MTDLELIVKEYRDEITQWWILCGLTTEEKTRELERQASLWFQGAEIKVGFAGACLDVIEANPIMLHQVSLADSSPGAGLST